MIRRAIGCCAALVAVLLVGAFLAGRYSDSTSHPAPAAVPGAVDVGFAQDMTVHHDQAVLMANLALSRGSGAVRSIADGILTSQSLEAGQLRGWLQLWRRPQADPHPMRWMGAGSGMALSMTTTQSMNADAMPGMASGAQLTKLYSLWGKRFDVLFLQLMIRHHEGGIEMAHYAELHARLPLVRRAATAMRIEQVQDIAIMRSLLAADGAHELPAP